MQRIACHLMNGLVTMLAVIGCNMGSPSLPGGDGGIGDAMVLDAMTEIDAMTGTDTPDLARIRVAVTGDDAADGITAPVKTLKRGVELATTNGAIKTISLGAGVYGFSNGESYPYTVPTGVKILGVPGTILAGTKTNSGLTIGTGSLQNVEFRDFVTAVHITGTATLTTVTMKTSGLGILADGNARVTASGLTVGGANGIKALGAAQIAVDKFIARSSTIIDAREQAAISISKGEISGGFYFKAHGKSLTLTDTKITGVGIDLDGAQLEVTLTNTTIADYAGTAISGNARVFRMTGGELRNSGFGAATLIGGSYTFTNVRITGNKTGGIYLQNGGNGPGTITMRGCTVTGNGGAGVSLFFATGDFGTGASPGNNTFRDNQGIGLESQGVAGFPPPPPRAISAVGNTWRPNTQGSDANGKYSSQVITGIVRTVEGNNFALSGSTLQL